MAMAASEWTVLIVSEDKSLNKTYEMAPNTPLAQVLQAWREDFRLLGNWVFFSVDRTIEYRDTSLTLEEIGELVPGSNIINLRVQLSGIWTQTDNPVAVDRAVQLDPVKNVKLLVFYNSNNFKPRKSRPEFQEEGQYWWMEGFPHIKCQIEAPVPHDGMASFDVIRDALAPIFPSPWIRSIFQFRRVSRGRDVARVTSLPNDEVPEEVKDWRYCDCDGEEFPEAELVTEEDHWILSGDKVLICGGGCRTVVQISKY